MVENPVSVQLRATGRVVRDLVEATRLDLAEQRAVLNQYLSLVQGLRGIQLQLLARVRDVEVAHLPA